MNETPTTPSVSFSLSYRNLRASFIAGFALNALLFFVPSIKVRVGGLLGVGGEEQTFSMLTMTRAVIQSGQIGYGLFFVAVFCTTVAFAVLAIKYPRRWLFIAGACYTAFWLIFSLFSGSNKDTHEFFLPKLLGYVASAMALAGFWVKPPTSTVAPQPTIQTKDQTPVT